MPENENAPTPKQQHGLFIRGTFKGTQQARSFDRADGTKVNVKPKIGLDVDGTEYEVKCADDEQMRRVVGSSAKGSTLTLEVVALPPFGARGDVAFTLPGVIESRKESWQ